MDRPSQEQPRRIGRRRFLGRALYGTLGAGLAATGYARFIEPWWLDESTVRIPIADLPPALAGLRIAHLTDLHHPPASLEEVARWVERTNARSPDLICMTGDYVTGHPKWVQGLADVLKGLAAPLGVLACLGNHDYGHAFPRDDADHLEIGAMTARILEDAGIEVLINRSAVREVRGARLEILGTGDFWSAHWDPAVLSRARSTALRSSASLRSTSRPLIVLAHNPDVFYELDRGGFDLMLSGHTHGGQVCIPLLGPIRTAQQHRELASGLHADGGAFIYTSRGVGYSYPVRFCCRPELPIIELQRRTA